MLETNHFFNFALTENLSTMRKNIFFLILFGFFSLTTSAQSPEIVSLYEKFKAAATFDHEFPREKVYLHLDNNAYLEGDSIWYKAYVVRASSLKPTDISKVLYVELLDAAGVLLKRQLHKIDAHGGTSGCFVLENQNKSGYYEIRAFTRAMLNWGDESCFSRVIPVFENETNSLSINTPDADWKMPATAQRTFKFEGEQQRQLTFYPEGGNLISGLQQRVAFLLTDGNGMPVTDTISVFNAQGECILQTMPFYEGRGAFVLPAGVTDTYAEVGEKRFPLPNAENQGYVLSCNLAGDYLDISVERAPNQPIETIGLAVFCREQPCYFDTLRVDEADAFSLPASVFRPGVNRIELFDSKGRSCASRLVFCPINHLMPQVKVLQNAQFYESYAPVSMKINVVDAAGNPCMSQMSVAVRDAAQELVETPRNSIEVEMLLGSEVRGYIHNPQFYFASSNRLAGVALDHLLMVQGWRATSFSTMCNHQDFKVLYPIEDRLILNGVAYKDNEKREPYANMKLNLSMFSDNYDVRRGECTTDAEGRFAFAASMDYEGECLAQVTTVNDKGKKTWSRVAFDRWFAPKVKTYSPWELTYQQPTPVDTTAVAQQDVVDPNVLDWSALDNDDSYVLKEAEVTGKRKKRYRPLNGNRYEWNGGKNRGKRFADQVINIAYEVERWRDAGYDARVNIIEFISVALGKAKMGTAADAGDYTAEVTDVNPFETTEQNTEGENSENDAQTNSENSGNSEDLLNTSSLNDASKILNVGGESWYIDYTAGGGTAEFAEDYDFAYLIRDRSHMSRYIGADKLSNSAEPIDALLILHESQDARRVKKGVTFRKVWGYEPIKKFFAPNYNVLDLPKDPDFRRTIYWNPTISTSDEGVAQVMFFNNANHKMSPKISIQGMTSDGQFFSFER